jgi:regulator of RNase E activity RraA
MDYDVPVRCGDVLVYPGDLVFADYDGIVVIPKGEVQQVLQRAQEKMEKESVTRQELLKGRTLREVYNEHGVL